MEKTFSAKHLIFGGLCGILGTLLYVLIGFIPFDQNLLYTMAMAWPILSIVFAYSLYRFVAIERQSLANQLSFVFAALGFTVVACMISVQLAVKFGIQEQIANAPDIENLLDSIRPTIRLIDLGLDVAWDLLIGTSLVFLFAAIKGHSKFRLGWALPALVLGITLMILNAYTFPNPPNTDGLVDIGPLIGLYIIILSIRLLVIGLKNRNQQKDMP